MELTISVKGNKYSVTDNKQKLLYNVKKKGFGSGKYILLDSSDYHLYSLVQTGDDRKPSYSITHNDRVFMSITCKSLFLDPTLEIKGKTDEFKLVSKDHRSFTFLKDKAEVGTLKTLVTVGGELQYEFTMQDTVFDDYLVLFVVAVDKTFGEMNKMK